MKTEDNCPIGALRLNVSVNLLNSILHLPEGIKIKKIEHNFGEEVASFILFGESLPPLDKRFGSVAEGTIEFSQKYIPVIRHSAIYHEGTVLAEQNWNDQ